MFQGPSQGGGEEGARAAAARGAQSCATVEVDAGLPSRTIISPLLHLCFAATSTDQQRHTFATFVNTAAAAAAAALPQKTSVSSFPASFASHRDEDSSARQPRAAHLQPGLRPRDTNVALNPEEHCSRKHPWMTRASLSPCSQLNTTNLREYHDDKRQPCELHADHDRHNRNPAPSLLWRSRETFARVERSAHGSSEPEVSTPPSSPHLSGASSSSTKIKGRACHLSPSDSQPPARSRTRCATHQDVQRSPSPATHSPLAYNPQRSVCRHRRQLPPPSPTSRIIPAAYRLRGEDGEWGGTEMGCTSFLEGQGQSPWSLHRTAHRTARCEALARSAALDQQHQSSALFCSGTPAVRTSGGVVGRPSATAAVVARRDRLRVYDEGGSHPSGFDVPRRGFGAAAPASTFRGLVRLPHAMRDRHAIERAIATAATPASLAYSAANHPSPYAQHVYRERIAATTHWDAVAVAAALEKQDDASRTHPVSAATTRLHRGRTGAGALLPRGLCEPSTTDTRKPNEVPAEYLRSAIAARDKVSSRVPVDGRMMEGLSPHFHPSASESGNAVQSWPSGAPDACQEIHLRRREDGSEWWKWGMTARDVTMQATLSRAGDKIALADLGPLRRQRAAARSQHLDPSESATTAAAEVPLHPDEQQLYWAEHVPLHGGPVRGLSALVEGVEEVEEDLTFTGSPPKDARAHWRDNTFCNRSGDRNSGAADVCEGDETEVTLRSCVFPRAYCHTENQDEPLFATHTSHESHGSSSRESLPACAGSSFHRSRRGEKVALASEGHLDSTLMEDTNGLMALRLVGRCCSDHPQRDGGRGWAPSCGGEPCTVAPTPPSFGLQETHAAYQSCFPDGCQQTRSCPDSSSRSHGPRHDGEELGSPLARDLFPFPPLFTPLLHEVDARLRIHRLPSLTEMWRWGAGDLHAILESAGFERGERSTVLWELERLVRVSSTCSPRDMCA